MTRHRGGGRGPARAQTRARAALSGLCVTGSPVEWVGGVCPSWGASRDRSSENKRLRAASCGGPDHRPELSLTCAPERGRSPYRHFQSLPPSQETAHSLVTQASWPSDGSQSCERSQFTAGLQVGRGGPR